MTRAQNLPSSVRDSLARLAESSDRASPTVFAGRQGEFGLLDAAARGAQRGEPGHTVVIHGVPGAGKTALLSEYAARLLEGGGNDEKPTIAVPLRPGDIDAVPVAILEYIDRRFREFGRTPTTRTMSPMRKPELAKTSPSALISPMVFVTTSWALPFAPAAKPSA